MPSASHSPWNAEEREPSGEAQSPTTTLAERRRLRADDRAALVGGKLSLPETKERLVLE